MAFLDFSTDQGIFDNLEEITFTSVKNAGNESVTVGDAGFYQQGLSEGAPSYGVYVKGLARFAVRVAAIEEVDGAKPRDTVTQTRTGDVYTVLRATRGEITQFWQLDCVDLILAADLYQSGTLSRPTNAQDTTGRASLATYATVGSAVACRLQPEGGSATDALDRRTIPRRFTAFLASVLGAKAKDKFTVSGTAYTVLEEKMPERIDELPVLILELVE